MNYIHVWGTWRFNAQIKNLTVKEFQGFCHLQTNKRVQCVADMQFIIIHCICLIFHWPCTINPPSYAIVVQYKYNSAFRIPNQYSNTMPSHIQDISFWYYNAIFSNSYVLYVFASSNNIKMRKCYRILIYFDIAKINMSQDYMNVIWFSILWNIRRVQWQIRVHRRSILYVYITPSINIIRVHYTVNQHYTCTIT